jgi:hypothetical protein
MYTAQHCETVQYSGGTQGSPGDKHPRTCQPPSRTLAVLLLSGLLLVSCTSAAAPAPTATPDPKLALIGTWTATVTREDILGVVPDFPAKYLCENAGTFNWKFNADGTFTVDQTPLAECPAPANPHIEDTWAAEGNLVTLAKGTPNEEVYEWNLEGEMMSLKHVSGECMPCKAVNTAHPWKRADTSAAK